MHADVALVKRFLYGSLKLSGPLVWLASMVRDKFQEVTAPQNPRVRSRAKFVRAQCLSGFAACMSFWGHFDSICFL